MSKWRILGVDNGTSLLGLSILDYDFTSNVATLIDTHLLQPKLLAYRAHVRLTARKGNSAARREWMAEQFGHYLDQWLPDAVAIETPFIGRKATRSSFEPLALSVDRLIDTILDHEDRLDRWVDIEKVSPHEAKRAVTPHLAVYDASKEMILYNIERHKGISLNGQRLEDLNEDQVDSIAIGYTAVTRLASF